MTSTFRGFEIADIDNSTSDFGKSIERIITEQQSDSNKYATIKYTVSRKKSLEVKKIIPLFVMNVSQRNSLLIYYDSHLFK